MNGFQQLNALSMINRHDHEVQSIHLFRQEELSAELLVLPPGTAGPWHSHQSSDEVLDVLQGAGTFYVNDEPSIGERTFEGSIGKSVLMHAGVLHRLYNNSDQPWIVRATYHERLSPRHVGRVILRAVRRRAGLAV